MKYLSVFFASLIMGIFVSQGADQISEEEISIDLNLTPEENENIKKRNATLALLELATSVSPAKKARIDKPMEDNLQINLTTEDTVWIDLTLRDKETIHQKSKGRMLKEKKSLTNIQKETHDILDYDHGMGKKGDDYNPHYNPHLSRQAKIQEKKRTALADLRKKREAINKKNRQGK